MSELEQIASRLASISAALWCIWTVAVIYLYERWWKR